VLNKKLKLPMKANETKVDKFLASNETTFAIPVYQRNYDWTKVQCQQLLNDIIDIGKNDDNSVHFIGSIVYVHDDIYSASGLNELTIIDGQQRLTTITLIYIAISDFARENENNNLYERINKTYLINQFAPEEQKLKLRTTDSNDKALKFIMCRAKGDEFKGGYSRLIENYEYFRSQITSNNQDIFLRGLSKLIFIDIALDRQKDNPQRIFESLNSTGLELSQADLIRNYILMGLNRQMQDKIYQNYWEYIERNAKDESLNKSRVSDFIRDFLTLKNKEIPNKGDVYMKFKAKYPTTNSNDLENTLSEIKSLVTCYNKLINPKNEPTKEIKKELEYINRLEINVAYPFLMKIYEDYNNGIITKAIFVSILNLVQSFTWRRFVVGLGTEGRNKIFMNLYDKIEPNQYLLSVQKAFMQLSGNNRFPRNVETKKALKLKDFYNTKSKNRAYLFEKMENYQNKEVVIIEGNSDITIEHIFPQTPDPKWKNEMTIEDFSFVKDNYLNTIGNLTLTGNNSKLGNKTFIEKRDMEGGYKDSRLWLNKQLSKSEKWDKKEIEKRFEYLSDRFFKIWEIPNINIEEDIFNPEVNIFEAASPKHKKLDYAIFKNKKLEVRELSKLYTEIIKRLFELNPEIFFATELGAKVGLWKKSSESVGLRQPFAVNDFYVIETHYDNIGKFEKIKQALILFECEDDLLIKYADA
jgi:uncharacterized protein with ParB-like and HNH nuclease domain